MKTPAKLGAYAAVLVAAFAVAAGAGALVDPAVAARPAAEGGHTEPSARGAGHEAAAPEQAHLPGGLMTSEGGYTLQPAITTLPAGRRTPFAFRVMGPDGRAVTDYDERHDQDLHLIAVRRDLTGFQHVHPRLAADGTWSVPLSLSPGTWRMFADFAPAGAPALTLGADVSVAGAYAPAPLPPPSATAAVYGYTVTLDGRLAPGQESRLTLSVSRNGEPVADLQPYLSAYGHLVVLRAGDLAYLHVHPEGEPGDGVTRPGPSIAFRATAPSVGEYRLFLDFKHDGVVRTAAFTVRADGTPARAPVAAPTPAPAGHDADGHSHGGTTP